MFDEITNTVNVMNKELFHISVMSNHSEIGHWTIPIDTHTPYYLILSLFSAGRRGPRENVNVSVKYKKFSLAPIEKPPAPQHYLSICLVN